MRNFLLFCLFSISAAVVYGEVKPYLSFEDLLRIERLNGVPLDALRFDELVADVERLLNGTPITLLTKSELYNPGYRAALKNKIECTIEPRRVVVVEGYLTLYDERLRNLADLCIYLDMPIEDSVYRRSSNKFDASAEYLESVLIPVHRQFVEPTKRHADEILAVARLSEEKILGIVEGILKARGFLN